MSEIVVPDWIRYECIGCGKCCSCGFSVYCHPKEKERLQKHDWGTIAPNLSGKTLFQPEGGIWRTATNQQSECVFLDENKLCEIHKALGPDPKPLTCKMYPLSLVHSGRKVYARALFSCPAVTDMKGPKLKDQRSLLRKLQKDMDALYTPPPATTETALDTLRGISFQHVEQLENHILSILDTEDLPLVRKILWAGEFVDRIERNEDHNLEENEFVNTLDHDFKKAEDEARNCGISRPRLGFFEKILLRQFQGLCNSLDEKGLLSSSFTRRMQARFSRLRLAFQYGVGIGKVPVGDLSATFSQTDKIPAVNLGAQSEELICRYLKSRFAGRAYFGTDGWNLPVLQGSRITLMLVSIILWHAKAIVAASGKTNISFDEVREAVMLTDHTFGHLANARGISQRAMSIVNRPGWPQKALLYTVLP